jgi:probable addiction module antidote protein
MQTKKWNIFGELKTEEDIQAFVDASIEEAKNDADPGLLAHALGVAAQVHDKLAAEHGNAADTSGLCRAFTHDDDPRIGAFDKIARSIGYHLTLAPLPVRAS